MRHVMRDDDGNVIGHWSGPLIREEDGAVLTDPDPLPDDHPDIVAFNERPEPYRLTKATFWRRCTDQEAETLEAVLEQAPAKMRQLFAGATVLFSGDPEFAQLAAAVTDALGAERSAELLAPEDG